ncbi:MAG: tetratricopeptide repeat protein [Bryobacteraceae bacterium]
MWLRAVALVMVAGLAWGQTPLQTALELFNAGQYQQSFDILTGYVAEHPESAGASKMLGMTQFMLGRSDEALVTMRRSVELAPADGDAWYYLGRLYFSRDNAVDALAALQKARELNPASVRTLNHLGQTFEALGRANDAEQAYLAAIETEQKQPAKSEWPYYNLGVFYMGHSKTEGAVPYLRQALERNPRFTDAMIKLGVALGKTGDAKEALALLEKAVVVDPASAEGHYRLGLFLAKQGRQQEADQHLARFNELRKR